jgi:hypothetical protein
MDETWLSLTLLSPLRSRSSVFFFTKAVEPPSLSLSTLNPPPLVINNRFLFLLPALWEGRERERERERATPTNNSAWAGIKIYQNGNAYIVNFLLTRIHHRRLLTEKWWFQREFPSFFLFFLIILNARPAATAGGVGDMYWYGRTTTANRDRVSVMIRDLFVSVCGWEKKKE